MIDEMELQVRRQQIITRTTVLKPVPVNSTE